MPTLRHHNSAAAVAIPSYDSWRKELAASDDITSAAAVLLPAALPACVTQYVDEDETLIKFAMACRRNGQRMGLGVKKPRTGSVKPRAGR
jgi:hypothetical protein